MFSFPMHSSKYIIQIVTLIFATLTVKWFMNGNTTSGVYTINPDEGTPFKVCASIII